MNALKDPRTTGAGLIVAIVGVLAYFGVEIPENWVQIATVLAGTILMLFARDKSEEG